MGPFSSIRAPFGGSLYVIEINPSVVTQSRPTGVSRNCVVLPLSSRTRPPSFRPPAPRPDLEDGPVIERTV